MMTADSTPPEPPEGLAGAGEDLWRMLTAGYVFSAAERPILTMACQAADVAAELAQVLDRDGMTVPGSTGQPRLHPAVAEVRQARLAVARLLGQLSMPDADEKPLSAASLRAKRAAKFRWDAERERAAGG